jgi:hypothetical protein
MDVAASVASGSMSPDVGGVAQAGTLCDIHATIRRDAKDLDVATLR